MVFISKAVDSRGSIEKRVRYRIRQRAKFSHSPYNVVGLSGVLPIFQLPFIDQELDTDTLKVPTNRSPSIHWAPHFFHKIPSSQKEFRYVCIYRLLQFGMHHISGVYLWHTIEVCLAVHNSQSMVQSQINDRRIETACMYYAYNNWVQAHLCVCACDCVDIKQDKCYKYYFFFLPWRSFLFSLCCRLAPAPTLFFSCRILEGQVLFCFFIMTLLCSSQFHIVRVNDSYLLNW